MNVVCINDIKTIFPKIILPILMSFYHFNSNDYKEAVKRITFYNFFDQQFQNLMISVTCLLYYKCILFSWNVS